ncbi:MAG: glycosyltransferase family 2 protein [Bacteroidetes bacterium]|nr:glycosyltransferase family 2 protein [Bacteroidota bacterium]
MVPEKLPLVTIIVPSFNKGDYIAETIESVIEQTYINWELIIIEDGSTDNSVHIITKFVELDKRITLINSKQNSGANVCRNIGINAAKGQYLIFLDADDLLNKNCLTNRIKIIIENPKLDFTVHTLQIFNKIIGDSNFNWFPNVKKPLKNFLSHQLPWQTMQPIWKLDFVLKIKGFDENFQRLQDVEFHTRALMQPNVKFLLLNELPDCYLRIDNARKNFDEFNFLKRWVNSVQLYCDKFYGNIENNNRKYLLGTIYRVIEQVSYQNRLKSISLIQFKELQTTIKKIQIYQSINFLKKFYLYLGWKYNRQKVRIPGINYILYKLLLF